MATGQASTKPPDANEYGGGLSHSPYTHCFGNTYPIYLVQMKYQALSSTPAIRQQELALLEKMSQNLLSLLTTASYHPIPTPSMQSTSLATTP